MKNIKLKKLSLLNYRNIKFAEYEFDGDSMIIGDNRIGKTNTLESIYYLLTDSLLNGSNDIAQIKPLDDTSKVVRIEGVFSIDGKELTLAKEYQENWVKTRGTTELVMKGHSTTYYYNGIKQGTLKEYNRLIAEDFGFEDEDNKVVKTKLLIDPYYLGEMGESDKWSDLRNFIIKLIGDVQDDDVFAQNETLIPIKEDLKLTNGRTDLLKKSLKNEIDGLTEQIIGYDAQVQMLEQTTAPSESDVAVAKSELEKIDSRIQALKNGQSEDVESRKIEDDIRKVDTELLDLKRKELEVAENPRKKELQNDLTKYQSAMSTLADSRSELLTKRTRQEFYLREIEREIATCTNKRSDYIKQLKDIDSKLAEVDKQVEKECPLCHHKFDESELAEKVETLKSEYAIKRDELITKGKANNETKNDFENKFIAQQKILEDYDSTLKTIESDRASLNDKIESAQKMIDELEVNEVKSENPKISELNAVKESLNKKLSESRNLYLSAQKNTNTAIYELEQTKAPYQKVLDDLNYALRCKENIEVVKTKRNESQKTLAVKEQKVELVKKFIYAKLQMLDENVKKVFGNIKFQLIRENINGGYDAICKPYIYDSEKDVSTTTTWKSGSKSERVITGIAIAEKIKEHLALPNLPYLFDEGGEISSSTFASKFKTDAQIICVKVVDNIDKPIVKTISK